MEEWLERHRVVVFLVFVVAIIIGLTLLQINRPQPPPIILGTSTAAPSPETTATPRLLRVYVSGAVYHPDVYTLVPDSIVKDALMAAGGPTDEADLDRINLALPIVDGQHIYVPSFGEENPPVQPPSDQPATGGRINVNTADLAALESLPGIGPVIAQRILDYRHAHGPFARVEDLLNVPGIGPATLDQVRDLITTD